jgi:hypothetical protein
MRNFDSKKLNKEYSFEDELKYAKEVARKMVHKKVALNLLKNNFLLTEIS